MARRKSKRLVVSDPEAVKAKILLRCVEGPNGCLLWTGDSSTYRGSRRYGLVRIDGIYVATHRAMYAATYGEVPANRWVLVSCESLSCCNPEHLYLGDKRSCGAKNLATGRRKGKGGYCKDDRERPINTPYTKDQVLAMREKYAQGGISQRDLAIEFGGTRKQVASILRGRTWARQTGGVPVERPDGWRRGA